MTTYWLIGEKPMGSNVQETITVSSVTTTVTSMTTTSNQVSIEQPRALHEDRASVAACQSKTHEVQSTTSKQNCQEQNHRAAQKGMQEQQRTNQQKGQEHRQQQVGGQGGSPELQNRSKDRSGGDGGRGGGKEDGGGGGGGRDWNDGSKDESKVERQGGEIFSKGNGLTSRARTISNGSSASPSRNRPLVSTSSTNVVSQGRRPYQASENVANHTESGSSAPLLVPTTPPSRV